MQIVNCSVFLNGDRNHMVQKTGISVAEVAVLQHLHGMDSVTNIQKTRMDKRAHAEERNRLRAIYKPKLVDAIYPNRPGMKLPISLQDLDLSMAGGSDRPTPPAPDAGPDLSGGPSGQETGAEDSPDFNADNAFADLAGAPAEDDVTG